MMIIKYFIIIKQSQIEKKQLNPLLRGFLNLIRQVKKTVPTFIHTESAKDGSYIWTLSLEMQCRS